MNIDGLKPTQVYPSTEETPTRMPVLENLRRDPRGFE
jgi:hypothetical protein